MSITSALGNYETLIGENLEIYFSTSNNTVEVSVPSGVKLKKSTIKRIEKELCVKHCSIRKDDEDTYSFSIRHEDEFNKAIEKYKGI